jgi:ADP-heptose:LPS heptosyltransferase
MSAFLENKNNIGIFRALQLGDMMCAIPAIRALKRKYPDKHITWIGLPGSQQLAARYSAYFDSFISFPGYPGLPEQTFDQKKYDDFLIEVREKSFDVILQMQGNGTIVNEMIKAFNPHSVAGYTFKEPVQNSAEHFIEYPNYGHEIKRHLLLMESFGIVTDDLELEFPINQDDYLDLKRANLNVKPKKHVCIHPGSRGSWRQWPPEHFAALGDYCVKMGYQVVITGTKEEISIAETVAGLMNCQSTIAAGKTSLGAIAVLIKQAYALISNCTGVSHMASALGTPSIVISMDGEPFRWAPLNHNLHKTIDWTITPDYHLVYEEMKSLLFASNRFNSALTTLTGSG